MRRRRLAAELHRLRAASHLTLEEVAGHLECSPAKVSRIENGQVAVRRQDARELLDLYDVDGERSSALLQMVRLARGKGWWAAYADLLDESAQTRLSLEDEASAILVYETNLVTALLQTRRYAWAVLSSRTDAKLDIVQRRVDLQMARQQILDRPSAPRLNVVLDEASLRRAVNDPDIMREQYERLATAAGHADISLRVLPFDAGAYQAMGFPFQIFEFIDDDPHLVYVELLNRGEIFESAEEVGRYRSAFSQVRECSLSEEESQDLLTKLAKEYR
jgi:transcriptional regulator with XRE-family HTH domain